MLTPSLTDGGVGQAGSLYGARVGVGPGVRPEDGLVGLPAPLVVVCAGDMHRTLFLLPAFQQWQLGVLAFFVSFCPKFIPMMHACSYFQSLTVFFLHLVTRGDICPGISTAATAARGPRSQPVSVVQQCKCTYSHLTVHLKMAKMGSLC